MNRHSIFIYIGFFCIFLLTIINWLFYSQIQLEERDVVAKAIQNANDGVKFYHFRIFKDQSMPKPPPMEMRKDPKDEIVMFKTPISRPRRASKIIETIHKKDKIINKVLSLELVDGSNTLVPLQGQRLMNKHDMSIYRYHKFIYIYTYRFDGKLGLVFRYKDDSHIMKTIYTAVFVNLAVLIFIILVINKIVPIINLKKTVEKFSNGNLNVTFETDGKDEISALANEFDKAIKKIKSLQYSRNLFLRNIMHELKTPLAKGKLILNLTDDRKNSRRLQIILDRFEYLLDEFSKIEKVTSSELQMDLKPYKNIDILDSALDILMVSSDSIDMEIVKVQKIMVDFELFSISLKNLIDNGLKYSSQKPKVVLDVDKISIITKGEKIKSLDFEKIFKRGFEDSKSGLGIGLYITYNIINRHGFKLVCHYEDGYNYFDILL